MLPSLGVLRLVFQWSLCSHKCFFMFNLYQSTNLKIRWFVITFILIELPRHSRYHRSPLREPISPPGRPYFRSNQWINWENCRGEQFFDYLGQTMFNTSIFFWKKCSHTITYINCRSWCKALIWKYGHLSLHSYWMNYLGIPALVYPLLLNVNRYLHQILGLHIFALISE